MSKQKIQQLFSGSKKRNKVLEQIPGRVLTFIQGISGSDEIMKVMRPAGYTVEVQKQGSDLLVAAAGHGLTDDGTITFGPTHPSGDAIRAVSDWYVPSFDRIGAALAHLHPEQAEYVFHGLVVVSGIASVVAATVLLDRLDDLAGKGEGTKERAGSAKADKKAMATLALRGFDHDELVRVRALVDAANSTMAAGGSANDEDAQEQRLLALKAWFDDWSRTAHAVVTTRGDLIKMGLAHRRAPTGDETPVEPAAPAPAVVPAAPLATPAAPATTPVAPNA